MKASRLQLLLSFLIIISAINPVLGQSLPPNTPYEDSLLQTLETKTGEEYFKTWMSLAMNSIKFSLDKSESYLKSAKEVAANANNKEWIAKVDENMGRIKAMKGDYDGAIALSKNALEIHKSNQKFDLMVGLMSNLGIIYRMKGKPLESIKVLEEAQTYFSKEDVKGLTKSKLYQNLSNTYNELNLFKQATETLFKAIKFVELSEDKHGLAGFYGNLGLLYEEQEQYKEAKMYYEKSLRFFEEQHDLLNELN